MNIDSDMAKAFEARLNERLGTVPMVDDVVQALVTVCLWQQARRAQSVCRRSVQVDALGNKHYTLDLVEGLTVDTGLG